MMASVSRVEPLPFPFEPAHVKQQYAPMAYGPPQHRRTRTKAETRNDRVNTPRRRVVSAAAVTAAVGDKGGKGNGEMVDGRNLPAVRLLATRCLHTRILPSPLSFYSLVAGFSHSIGNVHMAPTVSTTPVPQATTSTLDGCIPELPPGTKLSYLAEGGANIVYRIGLPDGLSPDVSSRYNGKLLRLRKLIDSSVPYTETIRNFDRHIRELFDAHELVNQEAVKLPSGFIAACNDQLRLDEALHQRPEHRHGVYLSSKEPLGLLVTDMTPELDSGACLWEFKPKWLQQSPSAPPNANRCRTCALRDMKNYDAQRAGGRESRSFCPLDLISDNYEDVLHTTSFIKGAHSRARVAKFLHGNTTLSKLRKYQQRMNAVGLPGLEAPSSERALSMTLRDCTMYVKVPSDESKPLQVRLGDLDFKTGIGGKLQYWRDIESRLIEEGWYSGTRDCQKNSSCALERLQRGNSRAAAQTPRKVAPKYDL